MRPQKPVAGSCPRAPRSCWNSAPLPARGPDYATSDRLRDELAALGVEVRDTPTGQETTVRRR